MGRMGEEENGRYDSLNSLSFRDFKPQRGELFVE
jgi:hypothetical protein